MLLRLTRPVLVTAFTRGVGGDVYSRAHALLPGRVLRVLEAGDAGGTFLLQGLGWVQLPTDVYERAG